MVSGPAVAGALGGGPPTAFFLALAAQFLAASILGGRAFLFGQAAAFFFPLSPQVGREFVSPLLHQAQQNARGDEAANREQSNIPRRKTKHGKSLSTNKTAELGSKYQIRPDQGESDFAGIWSPVSRSQAFPVREVGRRWIESYATDNGYPDCPVSPPFEIRLREIIVDVCRSETSVGRALLPFYTPQVSSPDLYPNVLNCDIDAFRYTKGVVQWRSSNG